MKTFAIAAAAVGLAVTATPALAGNSIVQTIEVTAAGLDLSTPEGQRMLDKRVEAAARNVCGVESVSTGTRIRSLNERTCYQKALAGAKRQIATLVADQQRGG